MTVRHAIARANIDAHMKFWVDTLGGKPMKFGPQQVDDGVA